MLLEFDGATEQKQTLSALIFILTPFSATETQD